MKKIKLQLNRPYRMPDPTVSNQTRLKQIYDSTFNYSKDKSPRNSFKKQLSNRYAPMTDRKYQNKRVTKYEAYLEGELSKPNEKPNRRYMRKRESIKDRSSANLQGESISKKRANNESLDMFKIRKTRKKLSAKNMSVSHSKIGDNHFNTFEEAKQLYKMGNFQQAIELFKVCMNLKTDKPEYQYYTAICYLNMHNYHQGYKLLEKLCDLTPNFKKTIFLFAAISAKHLQKVNEALNFCTQGIKIYPGYYDLLEYRAKLSETKEDYEAAHRDYELILKLDKNNVNILIKNADCLYKTKSYTNCLSNLSAAFYADKGKMRQTILQKTISVNLELGSIKDAKKDLQKLENFNQNQASSKLLFIKGLILYREGMKKQSILCFEESIKTNNCKQSTGKSLVEITKSKIDDRDFYSAFYHITRSKNMGLESPEIQIYTLFSEGVVNLMKRKIKEGNQQLEAIPQKHPTLTEHLKKIYYLYRAFAKFCLSDYKQAILDYDSAHKQHHLDIYARYNKCLSEGITMIQTKSYEEAEKHFNQSEKMLQFTGLNKIQSYLYRAAAHIEKAKDYMKSHEEMEELKSLQQIFIALKELDKAYDVNDSNSNMLYFRGLIYLYLGKFDEALQDILKAISKSEENVAKYFFFRGLTHASLGNNKQALNDYSICSNLDENFHLVYLHKAKIHFENQNATKGLEQLMKLKSISPNQDIKYHEACLNFVHGHFVMANVCCDEIIDEQKSKKLKILLKIKLAKVKEAKKLLVSTADRMICDIMLGNLEGDEISTNELQFFEVYHYHHYLGIKEFKRQNYTEAVNNFTLASKERNLLDLEQGLSNNSENFDQDEGDDEPESQKQIINKINYNIFICFLMNKEYKKAYEVFIRDIISAKQSLLKNQFIASFSHALFQAISSTTQIQQKQIYELNLFESKIDKLSESLLIQLPTLFIKTRICYLTLYDNKLTKAYSPKADPDFIIQYINLKQIENRPEPPWVKRQQSGLIFTDEITNINIEFQTTENDEEQEDEENQDNSDEEGEQQDEESNAGGDISVTKFKEKMKLGDSIERKLQLIMQKKMMKKKENEIEESD